MGVGGEDGEVARAEKAFAKVNRLLSEAQDVIGRELSDVEFHRQFPKAWDVSDQVYTHIEKARRVIARRR